MTKVEILKQKREAMRAQIAEIEAREPFFASPPRKRTPGRRTVSNMYHGLLPYKKPV